MKTNIKNITVELQEELTDEEWDKVCEIINDSLMNQEWIRIIPLSVTY